MKAKDDFWYGESRPASEACEASWISLNKSLMIHELASFSPRHNKNRTWNNDQDIWWMSRIQEMNSSVASNNDVGKAFHGLWRNLFTGGIMKLQRDFWPLKILWNVLCRLPKALLHAAFSATWTTWTWDKAATSVKGHPLQGTESCFIRWAVWIWN